MLTRAILEDAGKLVAELKAAGFLIATAESCTGGLIAAALTHIPGSSAVVDRGFVTYSNEAKAELIGVSADLIAQKGAVSPEVAREMALGGLEHSRADICVAVTGIAGPGGGNAEKPVGLVYLAAAKRNFDCIVEERRFGDAGREKVREFTVAAAFALVRTMLKGSEAASAGASGETQN